MAKCKACGQMNPDDSRFCSYCGHSLETKDNSAVKEALDLAGEEFDRDSMATLDKSRITYVCTVCGSINRIDQDKCSRCGKPRPRNEYVNALKRLRKSAEMKAEAETLVAPLPVSVPEEPQEVSVPAEPQEPEVPAVQEPIQEPAPAPAPAPAPVSTVVVGGQANAVTQPFVIVPYVNPMQPLRQYNPNQLYRYEPYTPEELEAMRAQREAEELQRRMEAEKLAEANGENIVPQEPVDYNPKAKSVRCVAVFMMILSLALMAFAAVSRFVLQWGEPELLNGAFNVVDAIENPDVIRNWAYSVGAILTLVFALIVFIRSIVRCSTGRARYIGGLFPTLMLIAYGVYGAGLLKVEYHVATELNSILEGLKSVFTSDNIAFYVETVLVVLMFVLCWFSPKNVVLENGNKDNK